MRSLIPIFPSLRRVVAAVSAGTFALSVGVAATLPFEAPLHTQPDDKSPVVGTVPAGISITTLLRDELDAAGLPPPPPGWIVLRSSGPFPGFVLNRDVAKDGTIKPGAKIRGQPLADAPLLLVVEAGDVATAREPLGDWSRASVKTDLIVYVNALPPESRSQEARPPAESTAPAAVAGSTAAPSDELVIDTPPAPAATPTAEKPAKPQKSSKPPKAEPTPVETAGAPRTFVGYLMRTRHFLGGGPKYDYQLVDDNGRRIALLELSALLATSPIDSFENRQVSVYGPSLTRPDVEDLILRVQTLRLEK